MNNGSQKLLAAALGICVTTVCATQSEAATFTFDTNLVQHHTFDTDVSDAFGRGATASVTGATISGSSVVGSGSLALNGTGFVDLGVKASLDTLTQATVSTWVNVADLNDTIAQIYANDGWAPGSQFHLGYALAGVDSDPGGSVWQVASPLMGIGDWQEGSAPNVNATDPATPTGWTHLAFVWNTDGSLAFYVDGTEVDNAAAGSAASAFAFGTDAQIGGYQGGRLWTGNIDDFRIYDVALTEAQIGELAVPEPGSLALLGIGGLLAFRRRRESA